VPAPSPADDYVQDNINLNTLLVDDPDCTFLMMASNDAIHGIFKGDYVLIDKARTPVHGNVVVAAHESLCCAACTSSKACWRCWPMRPAIR
jgi:DNA polymerase V